MGQLSGQPFPGDALLMAIGETQEGKCNCPNAFQGDAYFISTNTSLARAGHMAKPQIQEAEQRAGRMQKNEELV